MGTTTLDNLTSTPPNATKVLENDTKLVKDVLRQLNPDDNVTEDNSTFVVTARWNQLDAGTPDGPVWTSGFTGGGQLGTGSGYSTHAYENLWTWKVPFNYSVVEYRAIITNSPLLVAHPAQRTTPGEVLADSH